MPTADSRRILKETFGYDSFRPGQAEIVDALLAGDNVLAVMPTGSGKSLCFQIPALVRGGLAIVVSPLVALMEDQVAALKLAGVAAETINSSRGHDRNVETWRRVAAGDIRLLYLSPERLMTERMLAALGRLDITLIAVDEAHCISRWGQSFRPEYESLAKLPDRFPGVPVAALTATADESTRNDIERRLLGGRAKVFVSGFDRPNIRLSVNMRHDRKGQLLDFVGAHPGMSGIVYCLSRDKTEKAAALLNDNGMRALPYHAGMDKDRRTANQDIFMTEPGVVMVATIAFGMGIDKPDVRFVLHTDLPGSVEAYYQEIGRGGRDGLPADAHMFYGLDDIRMRRQFIEQAGGADDHRRREHKRLDALIAFCEAPECRRRALLAYFDEPDGKACGNCDICQNPPEMSDGTEAGQKALSAVQRTGQRFGAMHIVDVLRGANTEKIRALGHDNLPTYGAGADIPKEEWRSILRQLMASGFLQLDVAGHGGMHMTEKGADLLKGDGIFRYRRDTTTRRTRSSGNRARAAAPAADLTEADTSLLLALKELRREMAVERGVPAYVIFADRSLEDMARKRPGSEGEFAGVHGVGAAKLRDLAGPFLNRISRHLAESP